MRHYRAIPRMLPRWDETGNERRKEGGEREKGELHYDRVGHSRETGVSFKCVVNIRRRERSR